MKALPPMSGGWTAVAGPALWICSRPVSTSAGGPLMVSYDTSTMAGAYDVRLEMSFVNQSFQSADPTSADPLARISVRLAGNSGVYRIPTNGFPDGRYQIRIAALDESGLPTGVI